MLSSSTTTACACHLISEGTKEAVAVTVNGLDSEAYCLERFPLLRDIVAALASLCILPIHKF